MNSEIKFTELFFMTASIPTHHLSFETPIGMLRLSGNEEFLMRVEFLDDAPADSLLASAVLLLAKKQLYEYFEGQRKTFELPLAPSGTSFQQSIWQQLQQIEFGAKCSYGSIVKALQLPKNSARAVGNANGKNPIAIIIPCHRVIGENGKLTGYAGGLWRKQWLLEHEHQNTAHKDLLF